MALVCCSALPPNAAIKATKTHARYHEESRREYPKAYANRLRCAIACDCKSNMAVQYATLDKDIQPVIAPKPAHR